MATTASVSNRKPARLAATMAAPPPRGVTRVWEERSLGTSSSPQATAFRMMRPVPAQARAAVAASISKSVMEVT